MAQLVKNLSEMWDTWVLSLDWEDPLEKGPTTHPGILARRIPWTEGPGGLQTMGSQRVGHNGAASASAFSPLQAYHHSIFLSPAGEQLRCFQ